MSNPLFDELAGKFGPPMPPPTPPPTPYARRHEPPPSGPVCPRCAHADAPFALIHRHLDEIAGSLHYRVTTLEETIMGALDNLKAQADNLQQTITGTVEPALVQLAASAASGAGGISEADVQTVADQISTSVSGLATATQSALSQAGVAAATPAAG